MSRKQLTTLTSQGKDNVFKNVGKKITTIPQNLSQKQNKFMQHFQMINNVDPVVNVYNKSSYQTKNNQAIYMSKLQSYSQSRISQIERIIRSNEDQGGIKSIKNDFKLSKVSPVIHVNAQIKRNIQKINDFFQTQQPKLSASQKKQQQQMFRTQILDIGSYSEIIKVLMIDRKQQPKQSPNKFSSIYNTPTERPLYDFNSNQSSGQKYPPHYNFNTETQRNTSPLQNQFTNLSLGQSPSSQMKIRKADMLLVQILREKKRKGLVSDYYKIMQLKLFQLLDFILQDQPQFQGLSSIDKMKEVLKKLDSFKGKKVQGENKINLLKIFFQEFRNLKNQIAENQKKKPLQKVQNKTNKQTQLKQNKQVEGKFGQSKLGQNKPGQNKNIVQKWNKKPSVKETTSVVGDRKQKDFNKGQANKSVKGVEDQWLGELL